MGDTAFALGLFVMGNSRSLFALMACLETEKIQKMVFSDFDSLLCAPTVRIFKLEPVYTAGGCRAEKVLCAIKQNFCRRAVARQENLTWSGGKRPAWTAFCGCEYRFSVAHIKHNRAIADRTCQKNALRQPIKFTQAVFRLPARCKKAKNCRSASRHHSS